MAALTLADLDADIASVRQALRDMDAAGDSVGRSGVNWTRSYEARASRLKDLLAMRARMTGETFFEVDGSHGAGTSAQVTSERAFSDPEAP